MRSAVYISVVSYIITLIRWVLGLRVAGTEEWEYTGVELDSVEVGNGTEDGNTTEALEAGEYRGSLELTSLQPGTEYEVTVATSNSFGLGQHGDIYTFSTKPKGVRHSLEKPDKISFLWTPTEFTDMLIIFIISVTTQGPSAASASADASPRDSVLTSGADVRVKWPIIVAIACLLVSCKQ